MGRGGSRYGAGRPASHVKAEHCLRLDVRQLAKHNRLAGGSFSWRWTNTYTGQDAGSIGITTRPGHAMLNYSHNGQVVSDDVRVVQTACNYGGTRPWFQCPRCTKRVAVLYLRSGRFMCRHCGGIVYASQADDAIGRAWRRQGKLEARLGDGWARPKGMHRATRTKLLAAILACEERRDEALYTYMAQHGLVGLF